MRRSNSAAGADETKTREVSPVSDPSVGSIPLNGYHAELLPTA